MNKIFAILLVSLCTFCFAEELNSCSHGNMDAHCRPKEQDDWAFLLMVETWPGTFCSDYCCKVPYGVDKINPGFTLHGLWPNYQYSGYPSCCTSPYTKSQIEEFVSDDDLKFELDTYWPALKKCKFIEYEWDKHGTCASTVYNGTYGPVDYMQAAMGLLKRWDLLDALIRNGIYPTKNQTYETEKVHQVISKEIGKEVALHCSSEKLAEVRICIERPNEFNKRNPNPFDCPNSISSNCKSQISIPPIPSLDLYGCK